MTPEEFERLKEKEKEHLRAIKQLQATARRLEKQRAVQDALQSMLEGAGKTLDTYDEMMYRIALETARNEARYELATEDLPEEEAATPDEDALREFEQEQVEKRARELVDHMKQALTEAPERVSEQLSSPPESTESTEPSDEEPPTSDDEPDKTIGRM